MHMCIFKVRSDNGLVVYFELPSITRVATKGVHAACPVGSAGLDLINQRY